MKTHQFIPALLDDAVQSLEECFGGNPNLHLRVQNDDGSQTLCALIFWEGLLQSAKESLERFDDIWWLANSHKALGNIVFDYELV